MAVEKSSHDVFMLIAKMIQNSNDIVRRFEKNKLTAPTLKQFFADLTESLEFLYQELQILQPLFRESRKVIKDVSVRETFERIQRYYKRDFQFDIAFEIRGDDFTVHTNLGLLLQVFINLVDNAIYWLKQQPTKKRKILIELNSDERQVVIADS
jgi:C4-dicarboxylate-specific signal transduction histidine kinase